MFKLYLRMFNFTVKYQQKGEMMHFGKTLFEGTTILKKATEHV